jgi:hypothetical protein
VEIGIKVAFVAFKGEAMCFVHVLLNALDMAEKGHEVKIIFEGAATKQIAELADASKPFAKLYAQVKEKGLVAAVCKACAAKMEALEAAQTQGLPISAEMSGHPSLAQYLEAGYQIITL